MARNTDKNAYWYVGIPRHSATYQRLLTDAKNKGISVPALIAVRIDDFYTGLAHPALAPVSTETRQGQSVAAATEGEEEAVPEEVKQEEMNAFAALDAWG